MPSAPRQPATPPEEWVDRYGDFLYRFALSRLRNPHEAENAVQETLLAALSARHTFAGRSSERTWLVSILKHKIIDIFRKKSREWTPPDASSEPGAVNSFFDQAGEHRQAPGSWIPQPDELLENEEFWAAFRACLDRLPSATRHAFILRTLENQKGSDVCRDLQISSSNFWVMMHRARLQLRKCLEENWFQS